MSLAAKDFLFQLQLLVARASSDLGLRKSLTADTLSALAANGLKPPAGACFEVTEDKTPCGVVKEGSRVCLNLPNVLDLNQITFSASQNTKLVLSTPCNSAETATETTAETVETVATSDQVQAAVTASDPGTMVVEAVTVVI
jgi:hypothetical protein